MTSTTTTTTTTDSAPDTLTPETGIALFARWTAMWNGDFSEPERFLDPDFRIRFGNTPDGAETDDIHGPAAVVDYIARFRASYPALHYAMDGTPLVDAGQRGAATRWYVKGEDASGAGLAKSGIDLIEVRAGRIVTVWSVTGHRRFAA
ncbi:nuclear transport factor 2 family protein [Streptomyces sp. NPDC005485]|uniref:nuclear transport factor 2 family protein n=1 Tax=Streptomyces sp. NPDC005485 TaxID=3155591 RepID=UPI00339F8BF9